MTNTDEDNLKTFGIFNDSFPPIMDGVSLAAQNYAYWLHKKKQSVCVITPKSPHYSDNEPYPIYRYTSIVESPFPYHVKIIGSFLKLGCSTLVEFSFTGNKIGFGIPE